MTLVVFPGHAGRFAPLPRRRWVARISEMVCE